LFFVLLISFLFFFLYFRWNVLGIQGSLLSLLLSSPLYISSFTIGDEPFLFSQDSMKRALFERIDSSSLSPLLSRTPFRIHHPVLHLTSQTRLFERRKVAIEKKFQQQQFSTPPTLSSSPSPVPVNEKGKKNLVTASGLSVNWSWPSEHEATTSSATGKKMGATKRNLDSPKMRSSLCKLEMMKRLEDLLLILPRKEGYPHTGTNSQGTYYELKQSAREYQAAKRALFSTAPFSDWIVNPPHFEAFKLIEEEKETEKSSGGRRATHAQ
jgi:hypothetical protein